MPNKNRKVFKQDNLKHIVNSPHYSIVQKLHNDIISSDSVL